ncbi:MAG: hypothetical protein ACJ77M_08110 [Thermoleophilaceae bacterium]
MAIAVGGTALPALAKTSTTHWTTTKCDSYAAKFKKKHPHATSKQKKAADKTLKKHGCTNKVK